jgi:phenylacetate-CoA ligase
MTLRLLRKALDPAAWTRRLSNIRSETRTAKRLEEVQALLDRWRRGDPVDFLAYRDTKLAEILAYAQKHCPYYADLFANRGLSSRDQTGFARLPLLDKPTIRQHRAGLASNESSWMRHYRMNTGGSTGEPFEFIVSRGAGLVDCLHQEFLYRKAGYEPGDVIVALDGSSVPETLRARHVYWVDLGPEDLPYGRLSYSSLYLTPETMPYYVEHIIATRPAFLRGYPSFLSDIADYLLEHGITLPFAVKAVELTSENTYEGQVTRIAAAFKTQVIFQYGHSEVCVFAYADDDTYEYSCSPLYGLTEVLDAEGQPVAPGEAGEIVATGFHNFALPFIRFRTGDVAVFGGNDNGIVKLNRIVGRTQDYIYTKRGNRLALTALIFGQHYRAFNHIVKWQLYQTVPGEVTVRIVKGTRFSTADEDEIRSKFWDIAEVDVHFEFLDAIPLTRSGKFMFMIQKISH